MGTSIVITSGKGGTGKTTTTAAVASCLAALGKKTLCLDADARLKNLDLVLGMSDAVFMDFCDVIEGRAELEYAAVPHPTIRNLYFLTAPLNISPEDIDPDDMKKLISDIKNKFDYCIIDCPAGIGAGFRLAVSGADMAIVVTNCDSSSLRDGQRTVMELYSLGVDNVRLLVNRVKPHMLRRIRSTIDDVIDAVGAQLIGLISDDDTVTLAASAGVPLIMYNTRKAGMQYLRITRRLLGDKIPLGKV